MGSIFYSLWPEISHRAHKLTSCLPGDAPWWPLKRKQRKITDFFVAFPQFVVVGHERHVCLELMKKEKNLMTEMMLKCEKLKCEVERCFCCQPLGNTATELHAD